MISKNTIERDSKQIFVANALDMLQKNAFLPEP